MEKQDKNGNIEFKFKSFQEYKENTPEALKNYSAYELIKTLNELPESDSALLIHVTNKEGEEKKGAINMKGNPAHIAEILRHVCNDNKEVRQIFMYAVHEHIEEIILQDLLKSFLK